METTNPTLFLQPPAAHQNPPQGLGGLNPIDRLYSMQTSYFCGEDVNEPWKEVLAELVKRHLEIFAKYSRSAVEDKWNDICFIIPRLYNVITFYK